MNPSFDSLQFPDKMLLSNQRASSSLKMIQNLGVWQEGGAGYLSWGEQVLPDGKARVKAKNLLPSGRC